MKRKFYSYETFNREIKDKLREFLHNNNIYYELSGCWNGWHFEIKCNENELKICNNFLDSIY